MHLDYLASITLACGIRRTRMKFTQHQDNGTKIEVEIDNHASLDNVLEEFQNFLRACGYTIEYSKALIIEDMEE